MMGSANRDFRWHIESGQIEHREPSRGVTSSIAEQQLIKWVPDAQRYVFILVGDSRFGILKRSYNVSI
jgi:hypothetical protein